ncbi:MAG: hypothetical protein J6T88_04315 [Bacteroidales bacterium]|nr:hypothetical protein [Bacteroidales bacterium]
MNEFKYDISEEAVAAYLEGKGGIDDITFLNSLINDEEMKGTMDIIQEIDDMDEINEFPSFEEGILKI